jgi:hypothetical protein
MKPSDPGWPLHRRRRQRRLDLVHAKLDTACAEAIAIYREPIMGDRLTEKLDHADEVFKRIHAKVEARADGIIARESVLLEKLEKAFAPRETILDQRAADLDKLEASLTKMTNDPLPGSGNG